MSELKTWRGHKGVLIPDQHDPGNQKASGKKAAKANALAAKAEKLAKGKKR